MINTIQQIMLDYHHRLKYNIDNDIPVYATTQITKNLEQIQPVNPVDSFSQQLHNLVYLSAQINTEEYKVKGFEKSSESHGNVQIFKAEYNNIKEQIGLYAIDDSLGSKKY